MSADHVTETTTDDSLPTRAFPAAAALKGKAILWEGMTLRDYFAAKVIEGICASGPGADLPFASLARDAFQIADAMLAARSA